MKFLSLAMFLFFLPFNLFALELQKPKVYKEQIEDYSSWLMSEKLDGIRAYWDGKNLYTKNGNKIYAPNWFTKDFPKFELDGELWTKRNDFENIQNIVLDKKPTKHWYKITYNIFEVPKQKGDFLSRINILNKYLLTTNIRHLKIINQIKIKNKKHLEEYLEEIINKKGEGVIIKDFTKNYFTGRSSSILKVKKFYDSEGLVIGYNYKKNGNFKSLKIKYKDKVFNLGGGFSDKQRLNPPKIGDIVTFKYYDFTKNGIPKFASFLRLREKE